jgi:tetratricopeptide (TPR) repeat protein
MGFVANLVPYGLGLLAAGLLPIKKPVAYQVVFAALALLWGWLALHLSDPGWIALASFEAALLFLFGVIVKRFDPSVQIDLSVRKGPWALAGVLFIVYALLIFPLLSRFETPGFEPIPAEAPYSVVLFTFGILFFTVTPWAALLFAAPLVWALLGGPDASLAGQVGLQVALLAGSLFIVIPTELRQEGGEGRPVPGLAFRIAYRHRTIFGYGVWGLILATVLLFLLAPAGQLRQITINLALLSGLGITLWLAFPAWQSFWYRSVAWWMARAGCRLLRGARFALKWSIVVFAAAALWAYLTMPEGTAAQGDQKGGTSRSTAAASKDKKPSPPPVKVADSQEDWWRVEPRKLPYHVFFMALFSWLAYQAFRGRKRLVIGTFSGYGDEKLEKGLAAGLGPRLQSELARIADVYKVIDDMTPSAGRSVIEVTPGVLEVGDILKDASAIKLGPFNIPMNFFVGLLGSIVSGPRLTGALHKVEEDRFILTAEISGGGFSSSWRVDYSDFADGKARLPPGEAIQKLVERLAFRVATDLVAVGSPRWRAVRCYTDGLRSYREAQRQQRSKKFKLRDAERCLIRALNDDQRFMQCHYNLGVVYRELGENGSAQSAFRRALGEDPTNFDACYALAEVLIVADKKYREGAWFCKAAIGIKPDEAQAWDLEAYACRYDREEKLAKDGSKDGSKSDKTPLPSTDPAWEEIQELSEIATALAWRSLCRQALAGKPAAFQQDKATAFTCIRNLAVVLARRGRFAESRQVFRQAAWLAPHDPDLRLFEGRTLFWDGAPEDAVQAVEGVFAGGMTPVYQGLLWSVLAQLRGLSSPPEERSQKMRIAHRRFLDIAARVDGENLSELIKLGLESPDRTSPEGRS